MQRHAPDTPTRPAPHLWPRPPRRALLALLSLLTLPAACEFSSPTEDPVCWIRAHEHAGNAQAGPAGEWLPIELAVVARYDGACYLAGQLAVDQRVLWSVESGGGNLESSSSYTDTAGVARMRWWLGMQQGEQVLRASADSDWPGQQRPIVRFRATALAPARLELRLENGDAQQAPAGEWLPSDVVVRLVRIAGDEVRPVADRDVLWNVTRGGGLTLTASSRTDSGGVARTRWRLGSGETSQALEARLAPAPGEAATPPVSFSATAALLPSALVLADDFEGAEQWTMAGRYYRVEGSTLRPEISPSWVIGAHRKGAGGNPGRYREMSHELPVQIPDFASVFVDHLFTRGDSLPYRYDPAAEGAIAAIDYREDRVSGQFSVYGTLALRQNGVLYVPSGTALENTFSNTAWARVSAAGLTAADFHAAPGFEGATPARPDFSAAGAPIEFGYVRGNSARFPIAHLHGIDNWRLTIHR